MRNPAHQINRRHDNECDTGYNGNQPDYGLQNQTSHRRPQHVFASFDIEIGVLGQFPDSLVNA
jgi:hypothetical protein